jgi:hypothetical protein
MYKSWQAYHQQINSMLCRRKYAKYRENEAHDRLQAINQYNYLNEYETPALIAK